MRKKNTFKNNSQSSRIYFISPNADEDLNLLNNNKAPFIDKIYKSKLTNSKLDTYFINIKNNNDINEDEFNKLSIKFNKILNKSYKIFYKDNINKFVYIPDEIKENINKSFKDFIND